MGLWSDAYWWVYNWVESWDCRYKRQQEILTLKCNLIRIIWGIT